MSKVKNADGLNVEWDKRSMEKNVERTKRRMVNKTEGHINDGN
jgi:hypothetical protein